MPVGAQEQAITAIKDKHCRFCEIRKTSTTAVARRDRQMTIEEFNAKQPIDIADQYFIDTFGEPMTEEQHNMFNHIYQLVQEANRQ